jgi:hypothetical protein
MKMWHGPSDINYKPNEYKNSTKYFFLKIIFLIAPKIIIMGLNFSYGL